jgi:Phosphotransferase enzyme family
VTASAHARYETRLSALRDDEALLPAIARAAEPLGLVPAGQRLDRDHARFHPHRQPFATLVLRDVREPVLRVEAYDVRPSGEAVVATDAGWLRLSPLASDPALRTLPDLLAHPGRQAVVRYRPYRRCTVRFDRSYAKLFADRRGERMLDGGGMLWAAAERGELDFAVPRPERYDPACRTLWQSLVPGRPVGSALQGTALARQMGRALASLATADLAPRRVLGPAAALTRSARLGRSLVRSVPGVERQVGELLARLRDAHHSAARTALVPVHGNPHPGQWLAGEAGPGLVDFDGLALGQPELDAAALLAAVEFEDPARVPVGRLRAAFLAGYRERGGELDARLLRIYSAHRRLAKAVRVAGSLRADGDTRAGRHLKRALRELEREAA